MNELKNLKDCSDFEYFKNYMNEICGNCGLTFGSHHAGTSPWPRDYCPGHERGMDWENGPGTVFKSTGVYKKKGDKG